MLIWLDMLYAILFFYNTSSVTNKALSVCEKWLYDRVLLSGNLLYR